MSVVIRSTLVSRRFPALQSLTSDDVDVMVMPPPSSSSKDGSPKAAAKSKAGSGFASKAGGKQSSRPQKPRPPFRPCNPSEARETITLRETGYVGIHSPYDLAQRLQRLEVAESETRSVNPVFVPNAPYQARADVQVNYYLNSPDAETIAAERRYIQEKAMKNRLEMQRRLRASASFAGGA